MLLPKDALLRVLLLQLLQQLSSKLGVLLLQPL